MTGKTATLVILFTSVCLSASGQIQEIRAYEPPDPAIHREIAVMDSLFFHAYNTCDMETQANIYAEDIEFFHDQGGVVNSKKEILELTERNICGKVTRTLIHGSLEVYPIHGYGAVSIGYHKFFNNQEPAAESIPSKFIAVWKKENSNWLMTKVISLH